MHLRLPALAAEPDKRPAPCPLLTPAGSARQDIDPERLTYHVDGLLLARHSLYVFGAGGCGEPGGELGGIGRSQRIGHLTRHT